MSVPKPIRFVFDLLYIAVAFIGFLKFIDDLCRMIADIVKLCEWCCCKRQKEDKQKVSTCDKKPVETLQTHTSAYHRNRYKDLNRRKSF